MGHPPATAQLTRGSGITFWKLTSHLTSHFHHLLCFNHAGHLCMLGIIFITMSLSLPVATGNEPPSLPLWALHCTHLCEPIVFRDPKGGSVFSSWQGKGTSVNAPGVTGPQTWVIPVPPTGQDSPFSLPHFPHPKMGMFAVCIEKTGQRHVQHQRSLFALFISSNLNMNSFEDRLLF